MRNHLKYAAIVGAIMAPVTTVAAVGTASAHGGGVGRSSAFGISANGLLNIPQTPAVSSASRPKTSSLVSLPGNPLVRLSVLRAHAAPGRAEASVVDLKIAKAAISPKAILSAKLISARCEDGDGVSRLVDVRLAGRRIQAAATPNSTLTVPIDGLAGARLTINKQVRNPDGTLSVTALELAIQALGQSQTIDISSATCAGLPNEAPKPHPVPSDLPVTG
jgi:hypothetical protein